ncbi:hypothetical protein GF386_06085 [Candidatus Pacearchaeota archaeon]|nr:hypothetical protein [Candidatus Pacearchaeota archaeon]MBD3283659.1 hypothetical protein [Candidatus Pacearchaeota archaeon]
MPKKVLKNTKKGIENKKPESVTIKGTITSNQRQALRRLIGVIGNNEQDVVGKIITLWLYNEGFLKISNKEGKFK